MLVLVNRKSIKSVVLTVILIVTINDNLHSQYFTRKTVGPEVTDSALNVGGSWFDYNNDAYPDLMTAGRDVKFYINNKNQTFSSVDIPGFTFTDGVTIFGIWADYDNDGDSDVLKVNFGTINQNGIPNGPLTSFLFDNSGEPDYSLTSVLELDSTIAADGTWVDYDNDGDVDIYLLAARNQPDLFYSNNNGTFLSKQLNFLGSRFNFAQNVWIDYDNDTDMDLFIVTYSEPNKLFKNLLIETATVDSFELVTNSGLTDDMNSGDISSTWADYDNDGDFDVFVAYTSTDRFYKNNGDGTFTRIVNIELVNSNTGTTVGAWGDYDNDGDLDIVVERSGGNFTNATLYRNDGNDLFTVLAASEAGDIVSPVPVPQAGNWADFDQDGDLDFYVVTFSLNGPTGTPQPNYLFINQIGNQNSWIKIICKGIQSNTSAIGSRVRIKSNIFGEDVWQTRFVSGGSTASTFQAPFEQHFGIGDASEVDSVIIYWPSGTVTVFENLSGNNYYTLKEDGSIIVNVESDGVGTPVEFQLNQNFPNPFNLVTSINYSLPIEENVSIAVYDILGNKILTLVDESQSAGLHSVKFDGSGFSSGIYFYRLITPQYHSTKKMILMK